MTKAKHTPGPWRVSGHRLAAFAKLNGINVVVADCDQTLGYSESEANARLIAASPTMYEYINQRANEGDAHAAKIIASI